MTQVMTRAQTRTNFHSSRLIRILADLAVIETVEPGAVFAEKLALWVDFADAIQLCAVHNTGVACGAMGGAMGEAMGEAKGDAIGDEFARTRLGLENSITQSCTPGAGKTPLQRPTPLLPTQPSGLPLEAAIPYEPYRRFHLAHQRDMELNIRPLRSKARAALAQASPALRQLADLDATLDGILMEREKKLLATVPTLLEKRFKHLRNAHQQSVAASQQADNPDTWMKPGGWLARFCNELQTVLLAELDLRLQPTAGLIEACNDQKLKHA